MTENSKLESASGKVFESFLSLRLSRNSRLYRFLASLFSGVQHSSFGSSVLTDTGASSTLAKLSAATTTTAGGLDLISATAGSSGKAFILLSVLLTTTVGMFSAGVWEGIEMGGSVLESAGLVAGVVVDVEVAVTVTDGLNFLPSSLSLEAAVGLGASTDDLVAVGSATGVGGCCGVATTSAAVETFFELSVVVSLMSELAAFE